MTLQTQTDKFFLLDFDGVLIDSVAEAGLTAFNTVTDSLIKNPKSLPDNYCEIFKENRPMAHNAYSMVSMAAWCLKEIGKEKLIRDLSLIEDTQTEFFKKREELNALDATTWFELHKPFEPIWNIPQKIT